MTTDLEEQLTAGMREQVTGTAMSADVLGQATRRFRRRAATVRVGYALGVAGLAGALAAGLTLGGTSQPGGGKAPIVQAQPASVRLVNAVKASGAISYRVRLTTDYFTFEGAFDPRTATGYVRSANDAGILTELLIDGTRYIGTEPPAKGPKPTGEHEAYGRYGRYPGKYDRLSYGGEGGPVLGAAAPDPAGLLEALAKVDAVVTDKGDGTLRFEYTQRTKDGSTFTSGVVALDGAGRIAKVAIGGTWESTAKGSRQAGKFTTTTELSDYGVAVKVERPTDVVPAN
jgi:hypothetical protein